MADDLLRCKLGHDGTETLFVGRVDISTANPRACRGDALDGQGEEFRWT
jgi:hypothetical protein